MMNKALLMYQSLSVVLLNTIVLFCLLNLIAAGFLKLYSFADDTNDIKTASLCRESQHFDDSGAPCMTSKRTRYQLDWFDYLAYAPTAEPAFVAEMLDEFHDLGKLGFKYQPWVQFSESVFSGKHIEVRLDAMGFPYRETDNPRPLGGDAIQIAVLGGSTTFGYNVSQSHTLPSYLSIHLNSLAESLGLSQQVQVWNYGRSYYNPSQESMLFLELLKSGRRFDLVLFIDGVNWGPKMDIPQLTSTFLERFHRSQASSSHAVKVPEIAIVKMGRKVLNRLRQDSNQNDNSSNTAEKLTTDMVIARFQAAIHLSRKIAEIYNIPVLHFLQPDVLYNYPLELVRSPRRHLILEHRARRAAFYARSKELLPYIDLSNAFAEFGLKQKAILDDVHYSPQFNRFLAKKIAGFIDLPTLAKRNGRVVEGGLPTGTKRNSLFLKM